MLNIYFVSFTLGMLVFCGVLTLVISAIQRRKLPVKPVKNIKPINPQDTEKLIKLVALLSHDDTKLLKAIALHGEGNFSLFVEIAKQIVPEDLICNLPDELAADDTKSAARELLWHLDYIALLDWKDTFEELLFSAQKSLKLNGIDPSIFDDIPNQGELYAPQMFEAMEARLPEGYALGFWDFFGDCYPIIIASKLNLETAEKLGKELDIPIYSTWRNILI